MKEGKTHWLQNANKNYLGHWDLPTSEDLVLTIESAKWEDVTNPTTGTTEQLRIVHFKEDYKPLICNQINAKSILKSTGIRYMEDATGAKVSLYIGEHYDRKEKETIDVVRIRCELTVLPEITPEHESWSTLVKALKDGYLISQIKTKWTVSEANEKRLFDEAI